MEQNGLITIQKYAALNRMTIHAVVKKTMSGVLPTVEKEENGKKTTYIVMQPSDSQKHSETAPIRQSAEEDVEIDYRREYEALHKEYLILKTKYEKLLKGE